MTEGGWRLAPVNVVIELDDIQRIESLALIGRLRARPHAMNRDVAHLCTCMCMCMCMLHVHAHVHVHVHVDMHVHVRAHVHAHVRVQCGCGCSPGGPVGV